MIAKYLNEPERINVYGTHFSNINMPQVIEFIKGYSFEKSSYICLPSTQIIKDCAFQNVLNTNILTKPVGKNTERYVRLKGVKNHKTVSCYWLLREFLNTVLIYFFVTLMKII